MPVMLKEATKYLNLKKDGIYVDCTLGGAGYSTLIAKNIGMGKLISIDLDKLAIENAEKIIKNKKIKNITIINDNFRNIKKIIKENFGEEAIGNINGVVLDLGLSSAQLEDRNRGFSFQADAPLDMSFARQDKASLSTEEIVNEWPEKELCRIINDYGEEKFAYRIAKNIVNARNTERIKTTGQLLEIIKKSLPAFYLRKKGIHFATLTFQALRIATNDELNSLKEVLEDAVEVLGNSGRLVVISYHSLEDRIVKQYFKKESRGCICPPKAPVCQCEHEAEIKLIIPKALKPSNEEVVANPRSRSAKLRVVEKIITKNLK